MKRLKGLCRLERFQVICVNCNVLVKGSILIGFSFFCFVFFFHQSFYFFRKATLRKIYKCFNKKQIELHKNATLKTN